MDKKQSSSVVSVAITMAKIQALQETYHFNASVSATTCKPAIIDNIGKVTTVKASKKRD